LQRLLVLVAGFQICKCHPLALVQAQQMAQRVAQQEMPILACQG
jgi:hypothetical protein